MIQKPYSLHNKWCYTVHHTICNLIMCVCILYLHRFCTCAFICRKYGWSEPGSKHNMGTASCAWVESGLCHLFFLYQFSNVLVMILCKLIRKLVATIAYPNRSSVVRPAEWVHRTYKIFVGNGAADEACEGHWRAAVSVQHRGPGVKTTEVEAPMALVCASANNSRPLTDGTNLIWTVVDGSSFR